MYIKIMKDKEFLTQLALGTFDPYLLYNIVDRSKNPSVLTAAAKYFASGYNEIYEYGYESVSAETLLHAFTQNEFISTKLKRYVIIAQLIRRINRGNNVDIIDIIDIEKLRKLQNKLNKLHSQLFKD